MRMRKDLVETRVERPLSLMRASREWAASTSKGITSLTSSNWSAIAELAVNCAIFYDLVRGLPRCDCCLYGSHRSTQHSALGIQPDYGPSSRMSMNDSKRCLHRRGRRVAQRSAERINRLLLPSG